MADTVVSDAVRFPQDEGIGSITNGNESWDSAGLLMLLGQAVDGGSYVRSDSELTFANHDGTNDTVDVTGGVAYLSLQGETVDVQSGLGGSIPPSYDTTLPTLPAIMAVLPTSVTVAVQDATLSDVWLAYATDGSVTDVSAGDVYVRSDDTGSVAAPPHPSVKLGQSNPDDSSADVLEQRGGATGTDYVQASKPSYRAGAAWLNPDSGVVQVGYDGGGGGDFHPEPIRKMDESTSFSESNVTVTTNQTTISNGDIRLVFPGSNTDRPNDDSTETSSAKGGMRINPNTSLEGVRVFPSANSSGFTDGTAKAYVTDTSGNILSSEEFDASGYANVMVSLSSGTDYDVVIDNRGDSYTRGYNGSLSYPYTGSDLDLVNGASSLGSTQSGIAYSVANVTGLLPETGSGDALIEWPSPSHIHSWDLATLQRTLDGETVTVNIEDGSGTVLHSDIARNFDLSTVAASTNVALRANLSRSNGSNIPTLDYAARRFVR